MEKTHDTIISPFSPGPSAPDEYELLLLTYRFNKALDAPVSQPARGLVRLNLARCIEALFIAEPSLTVEWVNLKSGLSKLISGTTAQDSLQLFSIAGLATKHRAWSLLVQLPPDAGLHTIHLIAAEFLLAIRLDRPMRATPVDLAWRACMHTFDKEAFKIIEQRNKNYAGHLVGDLLSYCSVGKRGVKSTELLFEARVTACLVYRSRSQHREDHERSGLVSLTSMELKATIQFLVSGCLRGEVELALYLAAFRVGLPWSLFVQIPFSTAGKPDVMIQLDVQAMEVLIDLAQVFTDRATHAGESFVPTSSVLRLKIPTEAGLVIQQAYYNNPRADRLSELIDSPDGDLDIPGIHEGAIKVTVARLISSAGASAIGAGIDSAVAANLTLRLDLIGNSAHAYFNATSTEMLAAEQKWFASLGLSHPVVNCPDQHVAIGASSTPTQQAIQALYAWRAEQVRKAAPGRRCGIPRLLHFHDCFARAVAFMVSLCLGSRNESPMAIEASDLTLQLTMTNYQHKKTGPNHGLTVLPIPELLRCQIELWICHLERLLHRLEHADPQNHLIEHIQKVIDRQSIPLLFIASGGYKPLASADIFSDVSDEKLQLPLDFSRHFFMNEPRRLGVTHEQTEAWMRHHDRRTSNYLTTNMASDSDWMSTMSGAIDAALGSLKVRPIVGLGKTK